MKITICGSIAFRKEMVEQRDKLNTLGHEGVISSVIEDLAFGRNPELMAKVEKDHGQAKIEGGYIMWYYNAIVDSDAVLVLNYNKNGIENYVGGNTLMEMGFAYVNNKKIFLLNPIPDGLSYKEEIKAMQPIIINNDLTKICNL